MNEAPANADRSIDGVDGRKYVRENFNEGGYVIIENVDDMRWYTPLLEEEEGALNQLVSAIRFVDEEPDPEAFTVSLTALSSGNLDRLTLSVCTRDIKLFGQLFRRQGSMTVVDKVTLLNGITQNRLARSVAIAADADAPADEWAPVDGLAEKHAIIGDINIYVYPAIDADLVSLSRKPLSFYEPLDLPEEQRHCAPAVYQITSSGETPDTAFVVWRPGVVEVLDWDNSTPIHRLNERFSDSLAERFESDGKYVHAYLRFFCDFVTGDHGPFAVIESADNPRLVSADIDDDARAEIAQKLKPMAEALFSDGLYRISSAMIWFGSALFEAEFTVAPGGAPEMVSDTPVRQMPDGPTDWSRTHKNVFKLNPNPLAYRAAHSKTLTTAVVTCAVTNKPDDMAARLEDLGAQRIDVSARQIEEKTILGDVDLSDVNLSHSLVFRNCRFRGKVELTSFVCASRVHFENCVFEKTLCLDESRIEGGLSIWNSVVLGMLPSRLYGGIVRRSIGLGQANLGHLTISLVSAIEGFDLGQMGVEGDVNIVGTACAEISMFKARVSGQVDIRSTDTHAYPIRGNLLLSYLEAEAVYIRGHTIKGNLDISHAVVEQGLIIQMGQNSQTETHTAMAVEGGVDLDYLSASAVSIAGALILRDISMSFATIKQHVWIGRYVLLDKENKVREIIATRVLCKYVREDSNGLPSGIDLYGAEIAQNYFAMAGVEVAGNVKLRFLRVGTGVFLRHDPTTEPRNVIDGALEMTGLWAPRGVYIEGVSIARNITAKSMEIGELRIRAVEHAGEKDADGASRITYVEVGGSLNFSQAKITEDATLVGLRAGTNSDADDEDDTEQDAWSLNLRRAVINGNLTLFMRPDEMIDRFGSEFYASQFATTHLPRGVNLNQANIDADLVLSHVQCAGSVIELKDARVGHDILVQSSLDSGGPSDLCQASALLGNALECGGDIDLTGLSLQAKPTNGHCPPGSVMLEQARISGRLTTYRQVVDEKDGSLVELIAEIPGCLNLKAGEAGQVDISWHRFAEPCEQDDKDRPKAEKCGIVLEQAKIGTLSVTRDGQRYPVPVSLRFMEVKWWDFNGSSGAAEDYINFLAKDETIQSHTYYAVENTLLNQGQESAADQVHIAMHQRVEERSKRERRELSRLNPTRWLRALKSWSKQILLGSVSGYGTNVLRPSAIIFFWWLVSGFVFSYAGNIVPSEEGLAATHTQMTASTHPQPHEWNIGDGLWVAIRYHLPIVAFGSLDEWEPGNDSKLIIPNPASIDEALVTLPFSPESYAYTVVALHYILLPMAVFAASRKILRRREVG